MTDSTYSLNPICWKGAGIRLLDQTRLPAAEVYLDIADCEALAAAIRSLRVRGAPLLGIAGAYGLALAATRSRAVDMATLLVELRAAALALAATRPTAVNLGWALKRALQVAEKASGVEEARAAVLAEAERIHTEQVEADREIGRAGAALLPEGATILTHCNTGALATGGYGTALGVIRAAQEAGKHPQVFVDETRPLLQGARLTAWELKRLGIPHTLIVDGAAGGLMRQGKAQCVIVGADRIAANGDVANKVGTYPLAVLAKENGLPFYVAAPLSTVDLSLESGDDIVIEERDAEEVAALGGARTAPEGTSVANPAFDVTPHRYVSAIITERGAVRAPYGAALRQVAAMSDRKASR